MPPDAALEREAIGLVEDLLDLDSNARTEALDTRTEGRPDLRRRVEAILRAADTDTLRTGAAVDAVEEPEPPERIGAYRIMERIGRGGMGSVYRAERASGDFEHAVAVKIIKPGLLSDALIERFRRERQTMASLRHPNIAQLYDGGETADGSPYIIMELVDGLPLMDWVAANKPARETRQTLFEAICEATAFAHRNLIVHRDLTPANVLVTREGQPKLIDFGISRPAGETRAAPAGDAVELTDLSMTPGYAAPERTTSADVSTSADIYALGRLLLVLIPPEPEPADRELRAIALKASAASPLDRYATADALAADVRAWRTHRPVAAIGGGRAYAVRKFLRRYRVGAALAGGLAAALIGGLVFTTVANIRAEAARRDAERRFEETRAIAKTMLFDVYDEVSQTAGSTRARAMLARTGLEYLDALAADVTAPLDVRIEAVRGYIRLSQVTGGGEAAQLGRLSDAGELLSDAERIITELRAQHPENREVLKAFGALRIEQAAQNIYNKNEVDLARRQAVEAIEAVRSFATQDVDAARIYASALYAEGDSYGWNDDYAGALPYHQQAEAFIAALPEAFQREREILMVRSANVRLLGESNHRQGNVEAARLALDRAVEINRSLLAANLDNPSLIRKLSQSLWYRAVVHRTNGRDQEARASIDEAVALANRLRERDPDDAGGIQMFAITGEVQAQVLTDLGRAADGRRVGEQVIDAHRRLVELADNAAGARRSMAQALRTRGGNAYNAGQYSLACQDWVEARDMFRQLDTEGVLSEFDRNGAYAEMIRFIAAACDPPRRGLGDEV